MTPHWPDIAGHILMLTNLLTAAAILFGLFFLLVGALGLAKLPDLYNRIHAASKCVTLGISGLLVAAAIGLAVTPGADPVAIAAKAALVIVFQFVASPVGAHLLAKAAHLDGVAQANLIEDQLAQDRAKD